MGLARTCSPRRASLLLCAGILACAMLVATPARGAETSIRIGVTPVLLNYQTAFLNDWQGYLEEQFQRPVRFVRRGTYREIIDLLLQDKLDFAWICGYPFLQFRPFLRLLAVPSYQGGPFYQSYLIVPTTDAQTESIHGLKGKIFAFSDPDSNSGYLYTQYQLHQAGEDREQFFRKSFFTGAHDKVVRAVASGLADGGAVDGYIWDTLRKLEPELTSRTRIVARSNSFGFPPLVARRGVAAQDFAQMRSVLLGMSRDAGGKELLERLNIDAFDVRDEGIFDGIARMKIAVFGH